MRASLYSLLCLCTFSTVLALQRGSRITSAKAAGDAFESATDFLLDAKMQIQHLDDLTKEAGRLKEYVEAGGDKAR